MRSSASSFVASIISVGALAALTTAPLVASAADDTTTAPSGAAAAPSTTATDSTAEAAGSSTATATTSAAKVDPKDDPDSSDAAEKEGKTYYYLGLRYRHTLLPKWMLNLFVDGGPSVVSIPSYGIEGTMRKDGFDLVGAITYADYSMDTFPFKGKSEADTAYERVTSGLKLINFTVDILYGTEFSKNFSFQYGATVGLAVVTGDLKRNQAKPANGGTAPGDPTTYVDCQQSDIGHNNYCDNSNDHYPGYSDSSWINGGKKPNFYAVFGPMIALRYKPVKQFMTRLDAGFNIFSGFFFGLAANYGF